MTSLLSFEWANISRLCTLHKLYNLSNWSNDPKYDPTMIKGSVTGVSLEFLLSVWTYLHSKQQHLKLWLKRATSCSKPERPLIPAGTDVPDQPSAHTHNDTAARPRKDQSGNTGERTQDAGRALHWLACLGKSVCREIVSLSVSRESRTSHDSTTSS